jgi:UDP-GlcNAc:undecaprenyl-phosphate/decaprenyl-phosphate GlcNAc-1-phosphate transferase
MDLLLAFIIAVAVTMVLIPPLMRAAGALHVIDVPGERKQHAGAIPCVGGVAMAIGAFLPLLLWLPMDRLLASYLAASLIMVGFGVWDDRAALGPSIKFAGQLISVAIIVFIGEVSISTFTLTERVAIPDTIALPLTILFLLGVTNAINLTDGLDGLAGGTTLLACCALAALGLALNVPFVATIALVVVGSIVGFLRFNTYPARVFMGDGGSQFLGFTSGVLAIALTQHVEAPLSAALPLLILGLPILDTLTVMVLRVARGQSPFKADRTHLHHKLLALGFDHHEAVALIYCAQACLFLAAWFLRFESDLLILAVFGLFAAAFLTVLLVAERSGWQVRSRNSGRPSALTRLRRRLGAIERKHRLTLWPAIPGVLVYVGCVLVYAEPVPLDIGLLACGLAIILFLTALPRDRTVGVEWVAQAALYVSVVVAVYLDQRSVVYSPTFHAIKWGVFPALILAVGIRMRMAGKRRFQITPFDVLLIIVALTVPNLPGLAGDDGGTLGFGVAKLMALFYAVEMISGHSPTLRRGAAIAALLFCLAVVGKMLV